MTGSLPYSGPSTCFTFAMRTPPENASRPPPTVACGLTGGQETPCRLNCSRRTAPPRREPWNDRMSCVGLTFQGTWKKGENRKEPALNSPTYSYTPRHFVPVGSSMLGHWVPRAERMRTLPVQMLRQSHALMLSWHAGAWSAYGPSLNEVCPYYGPSKIGMATPHPSPAVRTAAPHFFFLRLHAS